MGRLARLAARLRGERGGINVTIGSASAVIVAVLAIGAGAIVIPTVTGGSGFACDLNAATGAQLTSQFSAATAGQTVCLTASTDYGTFTAGTKTAPGVTITPSSGVNATIAISLNGASNFTIDGTLGGGTLTNNTTDADMDGQLDNVTVKHMWFKHTGIGLHPTQSSTLTLDGDTFGGSGATGVDTAVMLYLSGDGRNSVLKNSTFTGFAVDASDQPDGLRLDTVDDGGNWTIQGNTFQGFKDLGGNHTDMIQAVICSPCGTTEGASGYRIIGNYFDSGTYPSQYITTPIGMHDSAGFMTIEDNVFRGNGYDSAMYVRSVSNSNIDHNTIDMTQASCGTVGGCGGIVDDPKAGDNAPASLHIYDNIMGTVSYCSSGCSVTGAGVTLDHNLQSTAQTGTGNLTGTPTFVGPNTSRAGFCLAANGQAGLTASDVGGPVGITGC